MTKQPTGGPASPAERRSAWRARAPWALLLLLVVACYCFFISTGHFSSWPVSTSFYDTQAEGFRAGQLHTTVRPHPLLLRVPNPYDYQLRSLWAWDYSLYGGRLYLYWGLTPAAALALLKSLLRLQITVPDSALVFTFLCLRLLAGSLLLASLARRFTPAPPRWALALAVLVFGLAHPTPFLLARPAIYEAAITGGACFMVCAYYLAFRWLSSPLHGELRWLLTASACLGLAGTTRPSLLPAAALFALLLFGRALAQLGPELWRQLSARRAAPGEAGPPHERRPRGALLRCGAAAFLPFATLTLLHLLVNQLRFDSWKEFGVRYQLGIPFDIGPRYLLANAFNYLFHPWHISCRFPFLLPRWHETLPVQYHLPSWLPIPEGYYGHEPLTGLVNALPLCWLLLLLPLGLLWARWRRRTASIDPEQRSAWRWFKLIVGAVTLVSSVPVLLLFAFSMRYEAEFASGLVLLSCLAGWRWLSLPRSQIGQRLAGIAYGALAVLTVVLGAPFGFTGYYDSFQRNNPALFSSLQEALSTCPASKGGCPSVHGCGP